MQSSLILEKLGSFGTGIGFLLFIIYQLPKIIDSITYFNSRKRRELDELIKSDNIDDLQREIFKEKLNLEAFRSKQGIRVNSIQARNALIALEKESKGEINFRVMKRANQFLEFDNNELTIRLPNYWKLFKLIFHSLYWALILLAIIYVIFFIINTPLGNIFEISTWLKAFSLLLLSLSLIASAFMFLGLVVEVESAEKIQDYIKKKNIKVTSDGVLFMDNLKKIGNYFKEDEQLVTHEMSNDDNVTD